MFYVCFVDHYVLYFYQYILGDILLSKCGVDLSKVSMFSIRVVRTYVHVVKTCVNDVAVIKYYVDN